MGSFPPTGGYPPGTQQSMNTMRPSFPEGLFTQSFGPGTQQSLGPTGGMSMPQTGESTFHDPTQTGAYSTAETPHDVKLAPEFVIHVTRLLDVPVPTGQFVGQDHTYVIHIYDEAMNKILATSQKIASHIGLDNEEEFHTVLCESAGLIQVTSSARVVHLEVEREGILRNESIGQCTISRLDPRSPSQHRYALTHEEHGAHCGIEIKVIEPQFNPKANVHKDPHSLPEKQRESMKAPPLLNNGYVAMLVVDKVTDIPVPPKGMQPTIFISMEADEKDYEEHELQRSGPFKLEPSPHNPQLRSSFLRQTTGVRAPLRVGGASGEGSMYLRIKISYGSSHGQLKEIAVSDVMQVRVVESPMQYMEIRPRGSGAPLGGIHLKHRLVTEETWKKIERELGSGSALPAAKEKALVTHSVDTTKPGGNIQQKQQLLNYEAQNRADYQRYKSHLPAGKAPGEKTEAGYRTWVDMHSMFDSMGPHPLAGGDSVGPRVVRGYEEDKKDFHNLTRALGERTSKAKSKPRKGLNQKPPAHGAHLENSDPFEDPEVARLMYDGDPDNIEHRLRPNICKDPEEIGREKNITWLQNSKYVPIRNMSAEDRETLRLSQYTHEQDAKMNFRDVVPHYRINEDIWGVAAEAKAVKSSLMRPPGQKVKRVKDDCIMA